MNQGNNTTNRMADSPMPRRESRKRRRVSERRRVFGRLTSGQSDDDGSNSSTKNYNQQQQHRASIATGALAGNNSSARGSRGDSPLNYGGSDKISMKIQFHITIAPDNEPLILDLPSAASNLLTSATPSPSASSSTTNPLAGPSIGDVINEKLNRQNTLSTRRRDQLFALHQQPAMESSGGGSANSPNIEIDGKLLNSGSNGSLRASLPNHRLLLEQEGVASRDSGARSSTITGGMSDEATVKFLERHHSQRRQSASSSTMPLANNGSIGGNNYNQVAPPPQPQPPRPLQNPIPAHQREHIFFKRDGQRFGHEFTLKLAVDKTYRCLLKVRPLIPLQTISIQGHHVLFADCSHQASPAGNHNHLLSGGGRRATAGSVSAPASSLALNNRSSSWQLAQDKTATTQHSTNTTSRTIINNSTNNNNHHNHRLLAHAQTLGPSKLSLSSLSRQEFLYQQQQNQMLRYFATSHCSTSHSHLGGQLMYMFDWSAGRFEVNKNKARTEVSAVLKFKNGQILSLPLQIKFYEPERRQHLNWGNQLHFIDFDCCIDSQGQIKVDRVQYY